MPSVLFSLAIQHQLYFSLLRTIPTHSILLCNTHAYAVTYAHLYYASMYQTYDMLYRCLFSLNQRQWGLLQPKFSVAQGISQTTNSGVLQPTFGSAGHFSNNYEQNPRRPNPLRSD